MLTGWAIHLGASPLVVGALGSLPFLAQSVQLPASWITAIAGRRRVALIALTAGRMAWLPLAAMPFLGLSDASARALLIAVAAVAAVLGVVGSNAQVAWLGEWVPTGIRGRWLARRAAIQTASSTLAGLAAAVVLDAARPHGHVETVLAALALVAALAGAATAVAVARQHPAPGARPVETLETAPPRRRERRGADRPRDRVDVPTLRSLLVDPATRRVLAYQLAWNAAVGSASAFVTFHLLQNLGAPFAIAAVHSGSVATIRILTAPLWGRALERTGSRPILVFCSFGIALIPAIWILPQPGWLWPLIVEAVISGCLWSGHGLAAFQLPLVVASRERRLAMLGAFAMVGGLGFAAATLAAGALATALPSTFTLGGQSFVPIHILFFASFLLRLGAAAMTLRLVEPNARSLPHLIENLRAQLRQTLPARALAGLLTSLR